MNRPGALFLDRDGVINVDSGYVHRIDDFVFIDGIFALCRAAATAGYPIVVVTNQAGIGRGYYSEQDFAILTGWMCRQFHQQGVDIARVYFCPYHAQHGQGVYRQNSSLRKPNPGMLLKAARELQLDLTASVMVGDKESDVLAARNAGLRQRLLFQPQTGQSRASRTVSGTAATAIVHQLDQAADFLLPQPPHSVSPVPGRGGDGWETSRRFR